MLQYDQFIRELPTLFTALFVSTLFIQSGLDKVLDRKGNLEWLTGHFSKSPLAGTVPVMLSAITVMEIITGLASAVGIFYFIFTGSGIVMFWAAVLGTATITALFFGQRVAKDYAGAAVLVPYFILLLLMMALSSPLNLR